MWPMPDAAMPPRATHRGPSILHLSLDVCMRTGDPGSALGVQSSGECRVLSGVASARAERKCNTWCGEVMDAIANLEVKMELRK